jgi:upstream activation factor subunit UAF30
MAGPTNDELKVTIRKLIPKVNLQKTGIKAFIKLLSKECGGIDLKPKSDYIKKELSEAINEMEDSSSGEESEVSEVEEAPKPKKKRAAGKGLSIKKEISEDLANFLGQGREMARTEIVKALWDYIKAHDLQNPENRREILLDANMKAVFGCDNFTMFTMNKYVAAHIDPYKPVDLTPKEKKPKAATAAKKRKRAAEAPSKKKRKAKKPGLQPPYRLSEALAEVVGKDILPRPQVVTALWDYIKRNELQVRVVFYFGSSMCVMWEACRTVCTRIVYDSSHHHVLSLSSPLRRIQRINAKSFATKNSRSLWGATRK